MLILIVIYILLQLFMETNMSGLFKEKYLYSTIRDSHYRIHEERVNWNKAQAVCEAEGASLLIPDSSEDFDDFRSIVSRFKSRFDDFHVGIHSLYSKGHFVTLKGTPVADTIIELYWEKGKPDDWTGNEECVVMTRHGLLDDRNCHRRRPFICRVYTKDIVPNYPCNNFDKDYKVRTKNKCYKLHLEPLTWFDANSVCALELGQLAVLNSKEETDIVSLYLQNISELTTAPDPSILFIGFSHLLYTLHYETIKDQPLEEHGYQLYAKEINTIPKRCGAISMNGSYELENCEATCMFVCEMPVNKTHMKLYPVIDIPTK